MVNQFLALSLFIMLLAFFIVLSSMSQYDIAKAKPVLNSLILAFSTQDSQEQLEPNTVEDIQQSMREGDALDRIDALFQSELSSFNASKNRLGTQMKVRLKLDDFEKILLSPFEGIPDENRTPFAQTLVSMMEPGGGQPYAIRMTLLVPGDPGELINENKDLAGNAVKTVSGFARILEAAGLPAMLMGAGLAEGPDGYIDLLFERYQPQNIIKAMSAAEPEAPPAGKESGSDKDGQ